MCRDKMEASCRGFLVLDSSFSDSSFILLVRIATLPRSNLGKDTAGCTIGARVEAE